MTEQTWESTQKMYQVARFISWNREIAFELRSPFLVFLIGHIVELNGCHDKYPCSDPAEFL